ncbi:DUF1398 family protein [Chitinophagaceae bacterium MMS25-I14]
MYQKIEQAYRSSENYPDLVRKLTGLGVQSYTVDVASGITLYRFANGNNVIHTESHGARSIAEKFDQEKTVEAVRSTQQGKTDYPAFLEDIAGSGVRFYEATLDGPLKRVCYIGVGGLYEEKIPL